MTADDRIERARLLYERAVFGGESAATSEADCELDAVEADLALARGRVLHARFLDEHEEDPSELQLFERAAQLYERLHDLRGLAEALFWVGTYHQVVRGSSDAALPSLERSLELATEVGDRLTMSYALRHLGIAEHTAGRLEAARERLDESTRLRRQIGFRPGVAANLVGLAYIAAGDGRREEGLELLVEAGALAHDCAAHRIASQVDEARAHLQSA
jgi:tetratricopeptide (TPR) repeat protein